MHTLNSISAPAPLGTDDVPDTHAAVPADKAAPSGTQTLLRGVPSLSAMPRTSETPSATHSSSAKPRSTTHRMLSSLVHEGYLHHVPYRGYLLGPKLLLLGAKALEQRPLVAVARPHLEGLAQQTGDTVHLGAVEGDEVLYLDKISGTKGLEMRSRVGQRMPLASTGVGKALMLGMDEARWDALYQRALATRDTQPDKPPLRPWDEYLAEMRGYREQGVVLDLEENEVGIRCVGAPVRDISGQVVAALSVASALPYMPQDRMARLVPVVRQRAETISRELGWKRT